MMPFAFARRALLLMGLAVVVAFATSPNAHALYWRDWPGSGMPNTNTNTTTGGGDTDTDTDVDIIGDPDPDPNVSHVPEPSTLLAGLIGLGVIGMIRRKKKPLAA